MEKQREARKSKTEIELDNIISLPGHVIDQILLELPIRDAVRTSLLSRKWRYRWAQIPYLIFDNQYISLAVQDQSVGNNKLAHIIDHVLLLHDGPIQKFKLSHRDLMGTCDIDRWILHLSRSPIKEFILEIWKGPRYKPPSCLFSCDNLVHLELFNCFLNPTPLFKGFRNLKSLDLQHITLAQDVFENLISSCPLLERLTLMNFDGFNHLKISAPNLQFFDIGGAFDFVSFENTFQLTLVAIGLYSIHTSVNATTIETSKWSSFFNHLPHVRRLEIQSYFLKYLSLAAVPCMLPKPCSDLNYLSIRINFNDPAEHSAALCILRSSPNLLELELLARSEENSVKTSTQQWEDGIWRCPFARLRLVKIIGISGRRPELEAISCLLSSSPALERMTIKPASFDGGWEMTKELLRFRRASVEAEIIYLDP